MFRRMGEQYCVAMLTHELLTAATSPGPSHYWLSMKKEPANHSANSNTASTSPLQLPEIQKRLTHTQALNLKTICMDLLTRIWVCTDTVHNEYKCYVFILWQCIHIHMQSSPWQGHLTQESIPACNECIRNGEFKHTHTQLTAHTHNKQHTLHHPSLDYSLIDTHQHRIKDLHTDGGGWSVLNHMSRWFTLFLE